MKGDVSAYNSDREAILYFLFGESSAGIEIKTRNGEIGFVDTVDGDIGICFKRAVFCNRGTRRGYIDGDGGREAITCFESACFFPFDDCVRLSHEAGISAFIQPGGSIRDADSIEYCKANDLVMVITGMRHFKH